MQMFMFMNCRISHQWSSDWCSIFRKVFCFKNETLFTWQWEQIATVIFDDLQNHPNHPCINNRTNWKHEAQYPERADLEFLSNRQHQKIRWPDALKRCWRTPRATLTLRANSTLVHWTTASRTLACPRNIKPNWLMFQNGTNVKCSMCMRTNLDPKLFGYNSKGVSLFPVRLVFLRLLSLCSCSTNTTSNDGPLMLSGGSGY